MNWSGLNEPIFGKIGQIPKNARIFDKKGGPIHINVLTVVLPRNAQYDSPRLKKPPLRPQASPN